MKRNSVASILSVILLISEVLSAQWAVLLAGSRGWYNYGQQTDICHAYQTLIKGGIPRENIIVFAYNDEAFNPENPFPGLLFNDQSGNDVYSGCNIDYSGNDVSSTNFLNVLKGNAAALSGIGTGRVLQTTSDDTVFINYSDHGGYGVVAMPNGALYAADLQDAISYMWANQKYGKMIFYMEACQSGSMFISYPQNMKFMAVTSADPNEPAWMTYCPPDDDVVNGVHLNTCLGDFFSHTWVTNLETENTAQYSLQQQYLYLQDYVFTSHVSRYGDFSFLSDPVANFLGNMNPSPSEKREQAKDTSRKIKITDSKLEYLKAKHATLNTAESKAALEAEIAERAAVDKIFSTLSAVTGENVPNAIKTNTDCYRSAIEAFDSVCGLSREYALTYSRLLHDYCALPRANASLLADHFIAHCKSSVSTLTTSTA